MKPTLEVSNLTKCFGSLTAVDNLSFAAREGEIIALLGPNGAGKSPLMNMITGYLAPTCGDICVLGSNIRETPLAAKKDIGFLSEGSPLYPDMSVRSFLGYMAELRGLGGKEKAARLREVCTAAKIENITAPKIGLNPSKSPNAIPASAECDVASPIAESLLSTIETPIHGAITAIIAATTNALCINAY